MTIDTLATWHRLVHSPDAAALHDLLAEDAVFHSPVVHTPQVGRAKTAGYLQAAFQVFFNPTILLVATIFVLAQAWQLQLLGRGCRDPLTRVQTRS